MDVSQVVPGIIDTHIHQWDPYTTPRHSAGLAKLFRPLPRIPRWLAPAVAFEPRTWRSG